jgi:glutamine amidotransferase
MITYVPQGKELSADIIEGITNGAQWNDDGHGWAIAAGTGNMITGKSLAFEEAIASFIETRQSVGNVHAVFHSRWATHGSVSVDNVHPFPVGRYGVVAHNGVLPEMFLPKGDDDRSDTRVLADEWLMHFSRRGTFSRREASQIASVIGYNKLVILSVSPKLRHPIARIVNAHMGEHAYGAWFSNGDYLFSKTIPARHLGSYSSSWNDDYDWRYDSVKGGYVPVEKTESIWGDCNICKAMGSVDTMSNYCFACHSCLDCGEHRNDCLCYTGQPGDMWARGGSTGTQPGPDGWILG